MRFFYENRNNEFYIKRGDTLAFPAHLHSDVEIVYILNGSAHAFSGGVDCMLQKGDFFISFPNCIHYYDNCSEDIEIYIAIIPWQAFPEYGREFENMVPKSPRICGVFGDVCEVFEKILNENGEYKEKIVRAYLSVIIGKIFERINFSNSDNGENSTISAIVNYCRENYKNDITLQSLSNALHISKSRLSHIFSEKIHMSFRGFVNALRLNDAAPKLLNSRGSITEIALEAGFENVRTFNRAFLKHFEKTPKEYRNMSKMVKLSWQMWTNCV